MMRVEKLLKVELKVPRSFIRELEARGEEIEEKRHLIRGHSASYK